MALTARQRANFESHYIPEPNTGCFLWSGYATSDGYGRFNCAGRIENAHRVAYREGRGPIPDGMLVRHDCDNTYCVNPDHLRLGSDVDNAADKAKRRRVARKLSEGDVRAVRAATGRYRDIAKQYGISASYVSLIKSGNARSYVEA